MDVRLTGKEIRNVEVRVSDDVLFKSAMALLGLYKYIDNSRSSGYRMKDGKLIKWLEWCGHNYEEDEIEIKDESIIKEYLLAKGLESRYNNIKNEEDI